MKQKIINKLNYLYFFKLKLSSILLLFFLLCYSTSKSFSQPFVTAWQRTINTPHVLAGLNGAKICNDYHGKIWLVGQKDSCTTLCIYIQKYDTAGNLEQSILFCELFKAALYIFSPMALCISTCIFL